MQTIRTQMKKMMNRERGVAMFMAIFALMLLTAISAGFVFMANTETAINANYRSSQQAYFAAKAGLEEARARIMTGGDIPPPAATPNTTAAGVIYVLNPTGSETIAPWDTSNPYFDNTLCKANYPALGLSYGNAGVACAATAPTGTAWKTSYASTLPGVGTSNAFPVKWTRITLKANRSSSPQTLDGSGNPTFPFAVNASTTSNDTMICWDGNKQILLPSGYTNCATPPAGNSNEFRPVYLLTSLAVLPNGSKRILSMEAADDPPFFSNSAINSQDYVTLNGALTIDGYDSCTCKCATVIQPSGKAEEDCSLPRLPYPPATSCLSDKYAIYSNSGVDQPNNAETITAGTNPVIAQNQTSKYDLDRMIDLYKNMAETKDVTLSPYTYSCTGSPVNCGTQSSQSFGVPPALPPTPPQAPADGSEPQVRQVTYVPGSLKLTSSAKGNGVLVIDGDLEINGGLEYYGLIIVKGVVKFTGGGSDKTNIYGSVLAGQSSIDQVVLGGSASIKYNRCALLNTSSPQPPRMLNVKEISF
jgi:Tfp pilus assembly protein PilX